MKDYQIAILIPILILSLCNQAFGQKDWELEHYELSRLVQLQWNEPVGDPRTLEEYLRWLDIKAEVRDRVEASLDQLNRLSHEDPENKEFSKWVQKYFELLENAEWSGENTVRSARDKFMTAEGRIRSELTWTLAIDLVRNFGRPLFTKASETRFPTVHVTRQAECLLNFAVTTIEVTSMGIGGLYYNRARSSNLKDANGNTIVPEEGTPTWCERRRAFDTDQKGEPRLPADVGLAWVNTIRDECLWWEFNDQYNDATDLMNQYYEDVLCKKPPHLYDRGHKWFLDLAEEYGLEKSIEYNKGFYGTVHGIVELLENGERKVAPGAEVTIYAYGQNWTTTADHDGIYKIEDAILHADCSPFDIYATHKGDRTDDTYNGYLTEPDKSAELLKDLLIERSEDWEWSGTMTVEKLERFDCELDKSTDNSWGHTKLHELSTTRATVSIRAENIDDSPPGFNINMGENLIVSGFMKCEYNNTEITDGRKSGVNPSTSHHKEILVGDDLFNLSHKNLNLMFTSKMEDLQKDGSLDELAKMLESGNMDQAKLEDFGKKFEESMGSGESGKSKISVFLTIFGDCKCKAILSQNGWSVKNGERTTINERENFDLEIGGGVALEFTADYVRYKDGSASITGNYNKTTPITGGLREGCPPKEETITCTLNLSKRPKK